MPNERFWNSILLLMACVGLIAAIPIWLSEIALNLIIAGFLWIFYGAWYLLKRIARRKSDFPFAKAFPEKSHSEA